MSHVIQNKPSAVQDRSRAEGRGSGRLPGWRRARSVLALVAVAAILVLVVILATKGGGSKPAATYGKPPSWLPKAAAPTDHLVTATRGHPKLAVEGDTVRVDLAHGQVDTTVVGPVVPEEGKFPVPPTSPCSFTITLTRVTGSVPLSAAAFTILAENGELYRPRVLGPNGGPVPRDVKPGHTVRLSVRAVLPTGGGQVRWTPETRAPISSWDFDVEID
jgi:hypothetical protein